MSINNNNFSLHFKRVKESKGLQCPLNISEKEYFKTSERIMNSFSIKLELGRFRKSRLMSENDLKGGSEKRYEELYLQVEMLENRK